jgi:hypothetical protein
MGLATTLAIKAAASKVNCIKKEKGQKLGDWKIGKKITDF